MRRWSQHDHPFGADLERYEHGGMFPAKRSGKEIQDLRHRLEIKSRQVRVEQKRTNLKIRTLLWPKLQNKP
jgi:hypothetical protein